VRTTGAERTGSAHRWGPLWGSRPADWAINEEQQVPSYEAAIARTGLDRGDSALDIGCGTGVFLRFAADRGAKVTGIDASEALAALARERVPEARIDVGDMEALPYEGDSFDLVTGFTSFFFAEDMVAALREAGRVAKAASPVVIQVWGDPDRVDLEAMKVIARPFLPPPPPDSDDGPPLWRPGVLEDLASSAGLTPREAFDLSWPYEYSDDDTLGRAMMAPAGIGELAGPEREAEVREAIVSGLAPFRRDEGSYRLENAYRFLIATA
jgi:SAM-dependent methyltransferase